MKIIQVQYQHIDKDNNKDKDIYKVNNTNKFMNFKRKFTEEEYT